MTSLAAVHTAAAIVVRALGEAGISNEVRLELDTNGIVIRPLSIHAEDWGSACTALSSVVQSMRPRPYGLVGVIDDVSVTASDVRLEVIA